MVGLSVVLEGQNTALSVNQCSLQVINKATINMNKNAYASSSFSHSPFGSAFLDRCYLCRQELLPDKDIYMYKGERAFCSEECRCRHIFMDEEESVRQDNCSMEAATSSSSASCRGNKRRGAFAF